MTRKRSAAARDKLLAAAIDVFVEKGFRDSTVAEICKHAEANIAAVNYHFGGKEALYREAWLSAFAESMEDHPAGGRAAPDAPAEARLRSRLAALVQRAADPRSKVFFLSQMEFVNPTGLLDEVMRAELLPLREEMAALVKELLGPGAEERQVVFCETCIISMCMHPMLMRRNSARTGKCPHHAFLDDTEAFAEHVIRFALAGIAATRDRSSSIGDAS